MARFESARIALGKLRQKYGGNFHANFGDHELGKLSVVGHRGGMRIASWHRAVNDLDLKPFWTRSCGAYTLMGIVSSLVALPVFEPDMLPEERAEWEKLARGSSGSDSRRLWRAAAGAKSDSFLP